MGNNRLNSFHYWKFGLEQIYVYRNGWPVADSPKPTDDDKRLYFNTIFDLAYIDNGHGIKLSENPNHFLMVFDLTSTQQASHDFIHPKLAKRSINVQLKFSAALLNNIEIFIIGEKKYNLRWQRPTCVQKPYIDKQMNEDEVNDLIQCCKLVMQEFLGVFVANKFHNFLQSNSFIIFNASMSDNAGTHWLLVCVKNKKLIFADLLGQLILFYKDVYRRLVSTVVQLCQVQENQLIQSRDSKLRGLFRIYIAHLIFGFQPIVKSTDNNLIRFALHMMMT